MAFTFIGMLASDRRLRWEHAVTIPFGNVWAIPLTGDLVAELVPDGKFGEPRAGFHYLEPALEEALIAASHRSPLAYVEIVCFGGPCDRAAMCWRDGAVVCGPVVTDDTEPSTSEPNAMNTVLRELGVVARGTADEFATIGFDRWQGTDIQYQGRPLPRFTGVQPPFEIDRALWVRTVSGGSGADAFGYLCAPAQAEAGHFDVWFVHRNTVESVGPDDIEKASPAAKAWIDGYLAGQRSREP